MRCLKPAGGGFTVGTCKKCCADIYGPAETTMDEICERCWEARAQLAREHRKDME